MRFGLVLATVTLFTIPQDFLSTFTRDRDRDAQIGLGAKRHAQSREDKAGIENEGVTWTYAMEQAAIRAYPAESIAPEATMTAQATFQSHKRRGRSVGQWTPIGPLDQARYPALLDVFLFDG